MPARYRQQRIAVPGAEPAITARFRRDSASDGFAPIAAPVGAVLEQDHFLAGSTKHVCRVARFEPSMTSGNSPSTLDAHA